MAGSIKVWVRPVDGQVCPLPMGEGNLALDGINVTFGGHWRLMQARGLCVVTPLKHANDAKSVVADQAEEKALRLVEMAKRARATAEDAIENAQKLRHLADESDGDAKKRFAADRKEAAANRKRADAEAKRQDRAKQNANRKALGQASIEAEEAKAKEEAEAEAQVEAEAEARAEELEADAKAEVEAKAEAKAKAKAEARAKAEAEAEAEAKTSKKGSGKK